MKSHMENVRKAFDISNEQFKAIVCGFKEEYATGLDMAQASGLATMIPSYVTSLPNGKERGTYLSLDLGGSTLRVAAVELLGNGQSTVTEVKRSISMTDPLRTATAETFFDWISDAVLELLDKVGYPEGGSYLAMGVCWSFPIDQTSLSSGKVLRMGKGFDIKGIEEQDLCVLFNDRFQIKGVPVKVTALLNDTVGTLVAHAYTNTRVCVGFIYGTGTNAAYPEAIERITKLGGQNDFGHATHMMINTEIDIFGSPEYLPLNQFDRALDAAHNQPLFQLYEKMMSGAYLGELVRLTARELISSGSLFDGHFPSQFENMYSFSTSCVSKVERLWRESSSADLCLAYVKSILDFAKYEPVEEDVHQLADLCTVVSNRAAKLAAAAIASLIEQQASVLLTDGNKDPIVIGITGSTFEHYPAMSERVNAALDQWFGTGVAKRISIEVTPHGGSIGGALIAMLSDDKAATSKKQ